MKMSKLQGMINVIQIEKDDKLDVLDPNFQPDPEVAKRLFEAWESYTKSLPSGEYMEGATR